MDSPISIACSMGIMAYNEEANIGRMLAAVVSQQTSNVNLTEIVVVASGCTDCTESIVHDWATRDQRIRLIMQPRREGKASAINQFLPQAREKIVAVCGGDLLPAANAIEGLVAPFADRAVGMTTGRPVPVKDPGTFMGFAAHLIWEPRHQISLRNFKVGEMVAFRKIFERIPSHTSVGEASIEPVILGQGYEARYVPLEKIIAYAAQSGADQFITETAEPRDCSARGGGFSGGRVAPAEDLAGTRT